MSGPLKNVDRTIEGLSIRNISAMRAGFLSVTNKRAAELLNMPPSTLHEWTNDNMDRACQVLAALGLKVVGKNERTVDDDELRSMLKDSIRAKQKQLEDLGPSGFGELGS